MNTPATAGAMARGTVPGAMSVPRSGAVLGDVVAWPPADGVEFNSATGHAGIYTGNLNISSSTPFPEVSAGRPMIMSRSPGDFGFISAGQSYVNYATGSYMSQQGYYGSPGFRRIGQ